MIILIVEGLPWTDHRRKLLAPGQGRPQEIGCHTRGHPLADLESDQGVGLGREVGDHHQGLASKEARRAATHRTASLQATRCLPRRTQRLDVCGRFITRRFNWGVPRKPFPRRAFSGLASPTETGIKGPRDHRERVRTDDTAHFAGFPPRWDIPPAHHEAPCSGMERHLAPIS
jgi:hypothetical protein